MVRKTRSPSCVVDIGIDFKCVQTINTVYDDGVLKNAKECNYFFFFFIVTEAYVELTKKSKHIRSINDDEFRKYNTDCLCKIVIFQ